ncbi:DUF4374 domain-containing protein [Capnocytophaga sp. oral taxon 878]|uniref:DUF4374 domain-containing protein n=1 Tax=Capnocytophaga sp. oral taxon 878 TaxID=1316596 RepID=UPI000D0289B1|nr:DUF4374 domain-containing protein [Capnocytophaga sp. oral taxon 878]AVM50597.1 hypothetical protein C4H12_09005 [Capnocytophaga sp. oral taxon 878]
MYINNQTFKKGLMLSLLAGSTAFISCKKDKNEPENPPVAEKQFLIDAKGTDKSFALYVSDLESGEVSISSNFEELPETGYFWSFGQNTAVGLAYKGQTPGIGVSYKRNADKLEKITDFQVPSRFTTYGFFDKYFVVNVGGQTLAGQQINGKDRNDGATFIFHNVSDYKVATQTTIGTLEITKDLGKNNKEIASFSGILDRGNGEFLSSMIYSERNQPRPGSGSTTAAITKLDSIWVAAFDKNMNLKRIYKSDKLGYSSGRFRSQYISQLGKADNGDVYVFSGHFEKGSTKPAGALLIKKDATDFDKDYFFNIDQVSGGHPFRSVFHITGTKFLIEFYNDKNINTNSPAAKYAIVDAAAKTLTWVTGLPDPANITSTVGVMAMGYKGKCYLPVAEKDNDAAIYVIDPSTAQAKKGLVVKGAQGIRGIGKI